MLCVRNCVAASRQRQILLPLLSALLILTAELLPAGLAQAQSAPRFPTGGRGYQRLLAQQAFIRHNYQPAQPPQSAPIGNTYSWYLAQPNNFHKPVANELGNDHQGAAVTIVGPNGGTRSFELQGPVIVNPYVRPTNRTYTWYAPPAPYDNRTYNWYELPHR